MNARTPCPVPAPQTVDFLLDGRPVQALDGESILHAAQRHGVDLAFVDQVADIEPRLGIDNRTRQKGLGRIDAAVVGIALVVGGLQKSGQARFGQRHRPGLGQ